MNYTLLYNSLDLPTYKSDASNIISTQQDQDAANDKKRIQMEAYNRFFKKEKTFIGPLFEIAVLKNLAAHYLATGDEYVCVKEFKAFYHRH